jgi:hypothetical protein
LEKLGLAKLEIKIDDLPCVAIRQVQDILFRYISMDHDKLDKYFPLLIPGALTANNFLGSTIYSKTNITIPQQTYLWHDFCNAFISEYTPGALCQGYEKLMELVHIRMRPEVELLSILLEDLKLLKDL